MSARAKNKKSLLNAIPPIERKWTAIMLIIDAFLLCILSYSYLFVESDYKTVETVINDVEWFEGKLGRRGGTPAQIRFYTENGMQFDFYIRGTDKNEIAFKQYQAIKSSSNHSKAIINYTERENIVSLGTLFESIDYNNVVSLEIDGKCILDKEEFESYNQSCFCGFVAILTLFTLIIAGHPIYCVISAARKRAKRKKSRKTDVE